MPNFSDITVVAIHGNNGIEKMLPSLERSAAALPGCRTLLITNRPAKTHHPQKVLGHSLDYDGYGHFMIYCLHRFIETDYVLVVQDDGWVLDAKNWRNEWFHYDYIGGSTHGARKGKCFHWWWSWLNLGKDDLWPVQNGGFSFRSRAFLEAPTKYGIVMRQSFTPYPQAGPDFSNLWTEDIQLCCFMRQQLEEAGLKFAPESESRLFAFDQIHPLTHEGVDLTKVFGQHNRFRRLIGKNHIVWTLPKSELWGIPWELRVLDLLQHHHGYEISFPSSGV